MSAVFWKIASEEKMRAVIVDMDKRFQLAMRQELRLLAQEKGYQLKPVAPAEKPKARVRMAAPRDVLLIPSNLTRMLIPSDANKILQEVCEQHGVTRAEFAGAQRAKYIVLARQEAAYRLSKETNLSLPQIGRKMGGRDHTTVLYSIRRHEARLRGESHVQKQHQTMVAAE